jgi:hypothetical protein
MYNGALQAFFLPDWFRHFYFRLTLPPPWIARYFLNGWLRATEGS